MSTTLTQPVPVSDRGATLLAEARARLSPNPWFQKESPEYQEAKVQGRARAKALFESPIGIAAVRISNAVTELHTAIAEFLSRYPTGDAAEAATLEALESVGLSPVEERFLEFAHTADHFASTPDALRGWQFQVELMCDLLSEIDPPEYVFEPDVSDESHEDVA